MRHPEAVDASSVALFLQPRKLLLPPDEVVHLLDLDPAEPPELVGKLAAAFLDRARPDLRCDRRLPTLAAERSGKRLLRCGIHWGRVEEPAARFERSAAHAAGELSIGIERVPRSEPDDRAEAALLHLAGELPRQSAGGERGGEEPGILLRAAAHVLERQPGTGLAPAGDVDLLVDGEPWRRRQAGRPGHGDLAEAEPESRAGVVGHASMPLSRIAVRDANGKHGRAGQSARRVRRLGRADASMA